MDGQMARVRAVEGHVKERGLWGSMQCHSMTLGCAMGWVWKTSWVWHPRWQKLNLSIIGRGTGRAFSPQFCTSPNPSKPNSLHSLLAV